MPLESMSLEVDSDVEPFDEVFGDEVPEVSLVEAVPDEP